MSERITVDQIMSWSPCLRYPRERVEELWMGRPILGLLDILSLDIPASDRIWVATRRGVLTREQRKAWLDRVVTRAVKTHALHCGVLAVESWAAKWLSGEDRSEAAARAAEAASVTDYAAYAAEAAAKAASWEPYAAAKASEAAARFYEVEPEYARQVMDLRVVLSGEDLRQEAPDAR